MDSIVAEARWRFKIVVVMTGGLVINSLMPGAVRACTNQEEQQYVMVLEENADFEKTKSKVERYGEVKVEENQKDIIIAEITEIEAEKSEQSKEVAIVEQNIAFNASEEVKEVGMIQDIIDSRWNIKAIHAEKSGTSYAAAHVTAVAALLWNEKPDNCEKIGKITLKEIR